MTGHSKLDQMINGDVLYCLRRTAVLPEIEQKRGNVGTGVNGQSTQTLIVIARNLGLQEGRYRLEERFTRRS